MRIYLAGPMTGIPQFNFPAFLAAAEDLRARGYNVISPAEIDAPHTRAAAIESGDGCIADLHELTGETWGDFLSRDVKIVADDCDAVAVLPGWRESRGAKLEVLVAMLTSKPVLTYPTMDRLTLEFEPRFVGLSAGAAIQALANA